MIVHLTLSGVSEVERSVDRFKLYFGVGNEGLTGRLDVGIEEESPFWPLGFVFEQLGSWRKTWRETGLGTFQSVS